MPSDLAIVWQCRRTADICEKLKEKGLEEYIKENTGLILDAYFSARNQVNLAFNITEGQPARIKDIHIVGNRVFSESKLKDLFDLDTGGWLSWYTKSNQYSRAKLNADLEALRTYYLTRGYLDFKIDSTQVAMSPDKESMSITINITEGERFVLCRWKSVV